MRQLYAHAQALSNKLNKIEIVKIGGGEAFLVNCGQGAVVGS